MEKLVLALDVSTTTTGFALMDEKQKLLKRGEFSILDRKLSDTEYTVAITKEVFKLVKTYNPTDLVIEDIYYSKNVAIFARWARVHGGLGLTWYVKQNKDPLFLMASEARRLIGIKGNATKIEVQLEICKRYKLVDDSVYFDYCGQFSDLLKQRKTKILSKNQFDYRIKKISKQFEELSGVSEHLADSIVLALAYFNKG